MFCIGVIQNAEYDRVLRPQSRSPEEALQKITQFPLLKIFDYL